MAQAERSDLDGIIRLLFGTEIRYTYTVRDLRAFYTAGNPARREVPPRPEDGLKYRSHPRLYSKQYYTGLYRVRSSVHQSKGIPRSPD